MKKRILLRLVSMGITAAILFSCGGQLLAAETDEAFTWGKVTAESAADTDEAFEGRSGEGSIEEYIDIDFDNDYLAEQYIISNMSLNRQAYNGTYDYESGLTGANLTLYNYLLPHVKAIAAGTETSSYFEIPENVLSFTFTYKELGIENGDDSNTSSAVKQALINEGYSLNAIVNALLFSCPYDMYWMDKTAGVRSGYGWADTGSSIVVDGFVILLPVAGEYQGESMSDVNSTFGQAVTAAAANAKAIITTNASSDDYNKLLAYAEAICDSVDYNYDAADENFQYSYGNPWQLIWVFDGDEDTKVVCEGYSKAFQYLCDNTAFVDDSIYAISVTGTVKYSDNDNPGGHMWNIVRMEDGKNYIVDVTAIDTGGSDSFLKGATSSTVSGCVDTNGYKYTYSSDTKSFFASDAILIASADYKYTAPATTYNVTLDIAKDCDPVLSASKAAEGDKITVTVNPVEGYEFDYITVNGTQYDKPEFVMPAVDVKVNVYCKKIDYTITVAEAQNGKVTTNTTTANVGDEITITATPDAGYEIDSITVKDADGNVIDVNNANVFQMPAANVTVTAAFKKIGYKVELGDIIKNCDPVLSASSAAAGDKITVTVNPVEGYEFDYITVNDTKITVPEFTMPAANVVVNVYCKKIDYTITVAEAQNGKVTTNTTTANVGDEITITATPDAGYEIDSITVKDADGNVIDVNNANVFQMPAANVTVTAAFKKISYKVELGLQSKNCTPKLSATSAAAGDKITVTVNPVVGFEFDYITVNDKEYKVPEFTMPAENVVVNVYCKKIDYAITVAEAQNGKVTTNTNTANVGDVITVTVTPDEGYELDAITVKDADGNVIDVNKANEFEMPASAVTVSATFKKTVTLSGWVQDGDIWYYYKEDGTKATGWLKVGAWYYFDDNGVMQTGWKKIDDVWYCFRNSGSMYSAEWLKWGDSWYYLQSSGAMATGWFKVGSTWYLFNSNGVMLTGWQKVDGKWYYLESSGAMKTGWVSSGGKWYYLNASGDMKTGWLKDGDLWYYLDPSTGAMVTGTLRINGKRYRFADDGHCLNP